MVGFIGGDPAALVFVLADDFLTTFAGLLAVCPGAEAVCSFVYLFTTGVADLPVVGFVGGDPVAYIRVLTGLRAAGITEHSQNRGGRACDPCAAAIVQGSDSICRCKPGGVLAVGLAGGVCLGRSIIVAYAVHCGRADLGAAAEVIVVGDRSGAAADHSANIGGFTDNSAHAVAVCYSSAAIGQAGNDTGSVALAGDSAHIVAVCQGDAGLDISHYTTGVLAYAGDSSFAVAAFNGAVCVNITNYAGSIGVAGAGVADHAGTGHGAVFDPAAGQSADNTGNILVTGDLGILYNNILDGACAHITEQAHVAAVGLGSQVGDRMTLAVEGTGIVFGGITDRCPFLAGHINVSHQLAVDGIASIVDQRGKCQQIRGVRDLVVTLCVFGDVAVGVDNDLVAACGHAQLVVPFSLGFGETNIGGGGCKLLGANVCGGHGVPGGRGSAIGGSAAVDGDGGDGGGPHIGAHLADLHGQISFLSLVIGQVVQLVGISGKGRQVQIAVIADHQRGEHMLHVVIAGKLQSQVTAGDVIQSVIADFAVLLQDLVDPEVPDVAVVVQQYKVLGIVGNAFLVLYLLITHRGDTHQIAAHSAQVEANGVQRHGILGGQQVGIVDGGDHIGLLGGEDITVGHIPQRNVVFVIRAGQQVAVGIHLVHLQRVGDLHHVEGILLGGVGGRGDGYRDACSGCPGGILGHVPGVEHNIVIRIRHSAVDGDLQQVYGDLAGSGLGGIQLGGCGNQGGAGRDAGDHTVFIHSGNAGIGAGPGDITVGGGPGLDIGDHLGCGALDDINSALVQGNSVDLIGGLSPVVSLAGLIRDHQAAHFVPEVVVAGEFTGGGVDLVVISEGDVGTCQDLHVGVPADHISVGIVFHTHVALGAVAVTADRILFRHEGIFHQQHGGIHGLERAGPDPAGAQLVEVEYALGAAGQRIGLLGHLTDLGQLAAELVDDDQIACLGDSIDVAVSLVVGHVVEDHAHIHHEGGIGQVVLGHDVQLALVGGGEDIVLSDGGCVVGVVSVLQAGGANLIIVCEILGEGGPVTLHQVVGHYIGNAGILTDLHFDQVGGGIHGVVVDLNQELLAVDAIEGEGIFSGLALFNVLLGAGGSQTAGAGLVVQAGGGDVLVVGSNDGHGVVDHVNTDTLQLGGSVINDQVNRPGSTLAQSIPIHIAVAVDVVFGNQGEGHGERIVFSGVLQGEVCLQDHHGVLPAVELIGVVGHVDGAGLLIQKNCAGGVVHSHDTGLVSMTDGSKANAVDIVSGVDGVTLGHIDRVGDDRVAAQRVVVVGVVGVADLEIVAPLQTGVGDTGILAGFVGGPGAYVKHGGVGPVAEEAEHGDGVDGAGLAVVFGFSIQVALQIGTVGIQLVELSLHVLGQIEVYADLHGAVGGQCGGGGRQSTEEYIGIVGVDVAVAVHISLVLVVQCLDNAGDIVQQVLAVIRVYKTVTVEVAAYCLGDLGNDTGTTDGPDHIHGDHGSGEVHVQMLTVGYDGLNEEISAQIDILFFVGKIMHGEGGAVGAFTVGIVEQLDLDLAVGSAGIGIFAHDDVGIGIDGIVDVAQAGALLQNGEILVLIRQDRCGGGHQQALGKMADVHTGLGFQIVFTDVLHHKRSHASHLGSCHGGAGLNGVCAAAGIRSLQGEDVAAGGSDLGLHFQRAGNAPGGEIGHGEVLAGELTLAEAAADRHSAGQIAQVALRIVDRRGILTDNLTLLLGQGDHRLLTGKLSHIQIDNAADVVVDHHSDRTGFHSQAGLLGEIGLTAGADSNLAGQHICQGTPVLRLTYAVDEHILLFAGQGPEGLHAVEQLLDVNDGLVTNGEVVTHHAVVFHGGNTHGIGKSTGLTHSVHTNIGVVQVTAVVSILHPGTGVAGRDGHNDAGIGKAVHDLLVLAVCVMAAAGSGTAQRQVDGVRAQNDGVFNGGKEVGIVGRTVLAKYLQGQKLRIRRNTLHEGIIQRLAIVAGGAVVQPGVGSGNTGNMGAMVTLLVIIVGNIVVEIPVVIAKSDLAVDISLLGIDLHVQLVCHRGDLLCVQKGQAFDVGVLAHTGFFSQLGQRVLKSDAVHALVIGVDTGIDHRDPHTGAGVSGIPNRTGTDLRTGGSHVGDNGAVLSLAGQILVFQNNRLDTGKLFNGLDLTVLHIGRDHIGGQGQVPDYVQISPDRPLDPVDHVGLVSFQPVTVFDGRLIAGNIRRAVTGVDGGTPVQNDGYTHHICVSIGRVVRNLCLTVGDQTRGDFPVIHLGEVDVLRVSVMAVGCVNRQRVASHHCDDEHEAQKSFEKACLFHTFSPLLIGRILFCGKGRLPAQNTILTRHCETACGARRDSRGVFPQISHKLKFTFLANKCQYHSTEKGAIPVKQEQFRNIVIQFAPKSRGYCVFYIC